MSLRATGCWELTELHGLWRSQGLDAVTERIAPLREAVAEEVTPRRVLVHSTGFRMSPYSDIKPAGDAAPRKLWHTSSGSPGH